MAQSRAILRRTLHRKVRLVTQPLALEPLEQTGFTRMRERREIRENNLCFQCGRTYVFETNCDKAAAKMPSKHGKGFCQEEAAP